MTVNLSALTEVLAGMAPRSFARGITRHHDFLSLCTWSPPGMVSHQSGPRWTLQTAGSVGAAPFAEGGAFPAADEIDLVTAQMDWGAYVATLKITGRAMDALDAQGDLYVANYLARLVEDAMDDLLDEINEDAVGGATANGIVGITAHINDTGTVAGINKATTTAFAAYADSTSAALSIPLMDGAHRTLTDTRGGNYDLILASAEILDDYTSLTTGNGVPAVRGQIELSGNVDGITFTAGYSGAYYRGRPVISVPRYGTRMDFVKQSALQFEVLRAPKVSEWVRKNDDWYADITSVLQFKIENPYLDSATLDALT